MKISLSLKFLVLNIEIKLYIYIYFLQIPIQKTRLAHQLRQEIKSVQLYFFTSVTADCIKNQSCLIDVSVSLFLQHCNDVNKNKICHTVVTQILDSPINSTQEVAGVSLRLFLTCVLAMHLAE